MKKKVVFFLPPSVGGAERVSITISKFLESEKYEVVYVILGEKIGDIRCFLPANKEIIHIKIINIWDFTITKIVLFLRKIRPEYTFSSNRYINVRVLIASRIVGGIKNIVRNDNGLKTVRWDNRILMRLSYPWAYKIIAQQEEMREELICVMNFAPQKVLTLHNPIDVQTIEKKTNAVNPFGNCKKIRYVWVGRFSKTKGQDILLKAFAIVNKQNPNTELYYIGKYENNDFYYNIVDFVNSNNLKDSVHFVGFDDNPYRWVKYCDCFVMPSRYEGLPNSLIEAMYIGKPVVATRCVPIVDRIVKDGYNGYLVNSEDYRTLAEKMQKALELKNFNMTYIPSSIDDFRVLFQ